jgi:cytochrome c2
MPALTSPLLHWAVGAAALLALQGCDDVTAKRDLPYEGIDPNQGARLIASVGCANCHIIPGIRGARGLVGPPLDHMRNRIFIAGLLRNTPDNMVAWLSDPQAIVPGNAMPNMRLQSDQARAITNYLYTLK